jgi:hypothetical protein
MEAVGDSGMVSAQGKAVGGFQLLLGHSRRTAGGDLRGSGGAALKFVFWISLQKTCSTGLGRPLGLPPPRPDPELYACLTAATV